MSEYIFFYGGWFTVGWIIAHILKLVFTRPKKGAQFASHHKRNK